jgi:hypothetical protein
MFVSGYVLLLLSATTTTATTTTATTISATQCDEPAPAVSSFEEYMVVAVEGTTSSTTTGSSFMTDKELYILEEVLMLSYNELVHCPSDLDSGGGIIVYNMDDIGFVQAEENVWNKSQHVESSFTFVTHGTWDINHCDHQDWLFASNENKPSSMCQCSRPNEKDFVALVNAVFAQATGRSSSRIVGVSPFVPEEE